MRYNIFSLFLCLCLGCDKDPCTDDTNPKCPNYNPCKGLAQTTARFKIYDRLLGKTPLGWIWQDTDTVSIGAIFEADMPEKADGSITYEWRIGAGIYRSRKVSIPDGMPLNTTLSATLIVRNSKPNSTCFPNDKGMDSMARGYYTSDNYYRMNGLYRGAYTSRPNDSIEFILHLDSTKITLPERGCTNYLGYDAINNGNISLIITPIGTGGNENCKIESRTNFSLDKRSKYFSLKYLNRPNSADTLLLGRKIKSL